MRNLYTILIFGLWVTTSCAPKPRKEALYQPIVKNNDASPAISYDPTRPDGGLTPYKPTVTLSPEEIAARKARNEIQPLVFGLEAAGISMQTGFVESFDILSPPLGQTRDGYLVYPERIAVLWSDVGKQTPLSIVAMKGTFADPYAYPAFPDGYNGTITLKDPVGQIRIGDSVLPAFGANPSESTLRAYLRSLGAAIEKRAADYDCEQDKTCRLSIVNPWRKDAYDFEFKRGFLRFTGDGKLNFLGGAWNNPTVLPPRMTEVIDYRNQSIGGLSLAMTRNEIQTRIGAPVGEDVIAAYYDRGSFAIRKGNNLQFPAGLVAINNYQGPLDFGGTVGKRYVGQSFADLSPAGDDGTQLMLALDRLLENRAPDFDCRTATTPCEIFVSEGLLSISLEKAVFRFAAADKTWLAFELVRP